MNVLNLNVFFQVIQYIMHLTCCIFMSNLDAKQVWRKNYEMFEFNYVRGQVRRTKQHVHVPQRKVAIVTIYWHCFMKLPSILLTSLLRYSRKNSVQAFLESGESLGTRRL